MNVPFVTFQCGDLKVFCVVYLQANRDFQKIIIQARNFLCGFYISCISTKSFKINLLEFWTIQTPLSRPPVALRSPGSGDRPYGHSAGAAPDTATITTPPDRLLERRNNSALSAIVIA